jgi:hypothetical protein
VNPRLTGDGKKVLKLLMQEYDIPEEAALKMMQPGGLVGRMLSGQVATAATPVQSKLKPRMQPKPKMRMEVK